MQLINSSRRFQKLVHTHT